MKLAMHVVAAAGALITHLHDFTSGVNLTEADWLQGIEVLTATGQNCDAKRQEFILLSDTLGLSMLVVATNNAKPAGATEATVLGPFHVDDAPRVEPCADQARGAPGAPLFVQARVRSLDGRPIADADADADADTEVDVWQADDDGLYDVQRPELGQTLRARGVLRSAADGTVRFRTVAPPAYPVPTDGPVGRMLLASGRHAWRPAHVHFRIRAPGFGTLVTHIFRDGDPYLDSDVVFGVGSSLIGDSAAGVERCPMNRGFRRLGCGPRDADTELFRRHRTGTACQGPPDGYAARRLHRPMNVQVGTTVPVPEPKTYALMLAGLGPMGVAVRRRTRP